MGATETLPRAGGECWQDELGEINEFGDLSSTVAACLFFARLFFWH